VPTARADEAIEGVVENRRVGRRHEGLLRVHPEPDDRLLPCRRIVRIATGVFPEDGARFLRGHARKSAFDLHEAVLDEPFDLRITDRARALLMLVDDRAVQPASRSASRATGRRGSVVPTAAAPCATFGMAMAIRT
jgi:hypothetical protein